MAGWTTLRAAMMRLGRRRLTDRLVLVSDRERWVIENVARSLAATLPPELRPLVVGGEWRYARCSIIHLVDRAWAWREGVLDGVEPSNRLIALWWHGRIDSPEPAIQEALARLRRLHPRFARVQATCAIGRETLLALGVPETTIVVLPEGVDLERFRPPVDGERERVRRRLGIAADVRVVGCFQKDGVGWGDGAEPKPIKGPDILAEVLIALHAERGVHALIPGPARGYVRRRLERAAVPFTAPGHLPEADLASLYHALDLYICPARDEGGPAGLLESMASGVAVVSTRAGMAPDLIEDGMSGGLADVDDVDGLAGRALALLDDRDRRDGVARQALKTIAAYDWRILAPRYVSELYRPVVEDRGP